MTPQERTRGLYHALNYAQQADRLLLFSLEALGEVSKESLDIFDAPLAALFRTHNELLARVRELTTYEAAARHSAAELERVDPHQETQWTELSEVLSGGRARAEHKPR